MSDVGCERQAACGPRSCISIRHPTSDIRHRDITRSCPKHERGRGRPSALSLARRSVVLSGQRQGRWVRHTVKMSTPGTARTRAHTAPHYRGTVRHECAHNGAAVRAVIRVEAPAAHRDAKIAQSGEGAPKVFAACAHNGAVVRVDRTVPKAPAPRARGLGPCQNTIAPCLAPGGRKTHRVANDKSQPQQPTTRASRTVPGPHASRPPLPHHDQTERRAEGLHHASVQERLLRPIQPR